jgi:hypothetical protein
MKIFFIPAVLGLCACATTADIQQQSHDASSDAVLRVAEAFGTQAAGDVQSFLAGMTTVSSSLAGETGSEHVTMASPDPHADVRSRLVGPTAMPVRVSVSQGDSDVPAGFSASEGGLLHRSSGLVCPFALPMPGATDDAQLVFLADIRVFAEDSSDVGCDYQTESGRQMLTVFASYWPDVTAEEHMRGVAGSIASRVTSVKDTPVPMATIEGDDLLLEGEMQALGGTFQLPNGPRAHTYAWINRVAGWHIKTRYTTFEEPDTDVIVALVVHMTEVQTVNDQQNKLRVSNSI